MHFGTESERSECGVRRSKFKVMVELNLLEIAIAL